MRLLVDLHGLAWDEAWEITDATISYTNHTLLPEALESWPVPLFERLLPRHMQIIYAINAQLLADGARRPTAPMPASSPRLADRRAARPPRAHGPARLRRLAQGQRRLGAAHRADEGDGVPATCTGSSRTASTTRPTASRRGAGCMQCQSRPDQLIRETIGDARARRSRAPRRPRAASPTTPPSSERFAAVKRANKERLAELIRERLGIAVDPAALFDVQIKRIHEYKRQLLNILETIALYNQIRAHPEQDWVPRVKIFAGKAAASYWHGEADHQAHQRRRRGGQQRSGRARPAQGRLPPELQCQPRRDDHAGRRSLRADLDRRHGGLGHRQHEARAERRAHHRHARRRQCRDPASMSAPTTSSSSA